MSVRYLILFAFETVTSPEIKQFLFSRGFIKVYWGMAVRILEAIMEVFHCDGTFTRSILLYISIPAYYV